MQLWRLFIIFCCLLTSFAENYDPYKILGVSKSATTLEIRRVYKKLAKEWHPDKTNDPEAQNKFVQIKQAYELLIDPERRVKFDQTGITEDTYKEKYEYSRFQNHPFEDIFNHAYFNFQENDITFFHRLSITARQYDKILIPKSTHTPHLIFFYTDWCFSCLQTAPYFRKLMDHLEPLGVELVTVHTAREPNLARRLNVHTLPCIVVLLDGNIYVYKETITSVQRIIEFLRNHLPYKLITTIKDNNIEEFLNGWEDNKVRGLIFEPQNNVRLRYLITAYHFRNRVAFGFVNSTAIRKDYQVPLDMDTVLLFNENTSRPVASISMKEIPTQTLHHIISSNQYLALPRLSSQSVLESLCPCEWNKPRKRLCVVLVTTASSDHDPHRQSFRRYAQTAPYNSERVRFAYIYHDKQSEFVNSLIPDGEDVEPLLNVVIIWRRDTSHVKYEWLSKKWETEENLNDTVHKLENTISRLLKSSEALSYEAFVKDLFDEHAKGIIGRIITKLLVFSERIYDGLNKEQILPVLSIVGTVIFIIAVGYFMAYLVRMEEESIRQQNAKAKNNNTGPANNYQPELRLHELRSEKYNGLVRLLKPGCRTIILVLDMQSRQQLIPPFHKAVWPYRKNKTLMFAYMYVERGLSWYKDLLQLSLAEDRELNINPRNCVGTVLAVNGYRKYFCMYHVKHPESKRRKSSSNKSIKASTVKDCEAAAFIGFNSDSSESDDEILLEGNLLDGLPNWLDRLFEGTTKRYHINYWPEFPNK
ncbi:hypothetical protein ILUMI_06735 [Ignelater luminosus]|uniref:DnaJ homolog subfamily C member 16 n=1 Tax=Ignelater luminosus TaxID=2038154 RepID=A0A8K0D565_IGNLU|nr:hypothetical protein ILUMI_06735 [Ignelater luminosus]